jgi:oligopeptide/dipeptide ABC transporter ATP-binding protein
MPTSPPDTPAASPVDLLTVRNLRTTFATDGGTIRAVDGVSFSVKRGQTICIVGESGSGKSVTALSIMGLVPQPPGKVAAEALRFDGIDLLAIDRAEFDELRGHRMAMVFQEPLTSLNPAFTVGDQIGEAVSRHLGLGPRQTRDRAVEMLRRVRIPSPETRIDQYPHQMSGGMRQRVMIAMAMSCDPLLLIADESTTALDVTIQAQILDLMRTLRAESGMSVIFITHDLGVVAEVADTVIVMYAGKIVESADVNALFADPQHPYTLGLLSSIPKLGLNLHRLQAIDGSVPDPANMPAGCRFHTRCVFADSHCAAVEPPLRDIGGGHNVACWKAPVENAAAGAGW